MIKEALETPEDYVVKWSDPVPATSKDGTKYITHRQLSMRPDAVVDMMRSIYAAKGCSASNETILSAFIVTHHASIEYIGKNS